MIERIKLWLCEHNMDNIEAKMLDGTATHNDIASYSRMAKYRKMLVKRMELTAQRR